MPVLKRELEEVERLHRLFERICDHVHDASGLPLDNCHCPRDPGDERRFPVLTSQHDIRFLISPDVRSCVIPSKQVHNNEYLERFKDEWFTEQRFTVERFALFVDQRFLHDRNREIRITHPKFYVFALEVVLESLTRVDDIITGYDVAVYYPVRIIDGYSSVILNHLPNLQELTRG